MAELAEQGGKLNVFISYSRDDLKFADQLRAALLGYDFTVTIDRESITPGEDWKQRLGLLIRDADTIVFVLSPSSARSPVFQWEAREAAGLNKRLLPILCRPLDDATAPPELAALQYTYFYEEPKFPGTGFGTGLNSLRLALNSDPEWLREHTRYLRLAKEWEEVGKPSDRRLLSAADIGLAEKWIEDQPGKAAPPTALQLEFIRASKAEDIRRQSAEAQRLREVAKALDERKMALRGEAKQARRVKWVSLAALVAVAILVAVAGMLLSKANAERNSAQRLLDQALAQSINNDLGLVPNESLDPRQRYALWKLALADKSTKDAFVSILARNPDDTVRSSPGFAQIFRALGLLRLSAAEADSLLEPLLKRIGQTTDPDALEPLVYALQALATTLSEAQASQAVPPLLKLIGQATTAGARQALAGALQALPVKLSEAQASQTLEALLKQVGQTTDPDAFLALGSALQALASKLSEAQADLALEPLLKQIGQTTDSDAVGALARALQALASKLSEAQADLALDPLLKQIGQMTDPNALRALGSALQALAPKLSREQANQALEPLLKQISQITNPFTLKALAQALQALPVKLSEGQASQVLDLVLKQIGQARTVQAVEALGETLQALASKLTEPQASRALEPILKQIGPTTNPYVLQALAQALQALPVKLSEGQASQVLDLVLKQIGQTTQPNALESLVQALQALPVKLSEGQASRFLT